MNFVPRLERTPEPLPPAAPRRLWLMSVIVTIFVSLSLVAVTWHVLEGSGVFSLIQTPQPRPPRGKIIEQYTRFRTEPVGGGEVVTGYRYASSTDAAPEGQYCYLMTRKERACGTNCRSRARTAAKPKPTQPSFRKKLRSWGSQPTTRQGSRVSVAASTRGSRGDVARTA